MIAEDYCSQEVVKLLKAKGFPAGVGSWSKGFVWDGEGYVSGLVKHEDSITHQMAMKWLREKGIYITINFNPTDLDGITWWIQILSKEHYKELLDAPTYEEAVEAALKYILENLI